MTAPVIQPFAQFVCFKIGTRHPTSCCALITLPGWELKLKPWDGSLWEAGGAVSTMTARY
jgi:hypothetical protein